MNVYIPRDSNGWRPSIEEPDWRDGAFIPKSKIGRQANTIPWHTVEINPLYECRYHPYSVVTVRNKRTRVECIQRWWDILEPARGKYVNMWKDGKKVRVDLDHFSIYRTNNIKHKKPRGNK